MRRNMKITIAAMAVLLVMAVAATVISFSFADDSDEGTITEEELLALAADDAVSLTNIDYIIQNSNDAASDDQEYHIVEIGSSSTPSTLNDFVTSGDFAEYVLNEHRSSTIEELMAEGKVTYQYIQASTMTNTDARLADVAKADLIYVSNIGGGYAVGNDICEELYNLLHTYAVGDYKPLIIDSPTASGSTEVIDSQRSFQQLVENYYAKSGGQYYTYGWDTTKLTTAEAFFQGGVGSGSKYIGINASSASVRANWIPIVNASDASDAGNMARFLVISSDGTSGVRTDAIFSGMTAAADGTYVKADDSGEGDTSISSKVYKLDNNDVIYKYVYNPRYASFNPNYVGVEVISLADLEAGVSSGDFSFDVYDLVVIEDNCTGSTSISAGLYKQMIAAMYANIHIVYNSSLGTAAGDTATGGNLDNFNETNYSELFYMVATDKEIARYQNIMVTNQTEFDIITSSKSAATCQVIADLINASAWRGIGGPGSSSSVFTVLEIQPCYPINTALETKNGTYYTNPSELVNGQTAEQLGIETTQQTDSDGNTTTQIDSSSLTGNEAEFYDWELSEAMVAEALNLDASQIKVVHMSTEELECYKGDILGSYDMIYIGGNQSALKSVGERKGLYALLGWNTLMNAASNAALAPTYTMYSHTGDVALMNFSFLGSAGNKTASGSYPIGKADTDTSGSKTFTTLSGNDLSYNNYLDLVEYVDAGMPVVFSSVASAGYDIAVTEGYEQNTIDPDSNMYRFMKYCKTKSDAGSYAIQWNLNVSSKELVDNNGGQYGSTQTGYVSVLTESEARTLSTAYLHGTKRPKLAVTSKPAQYSLYDESTKLTDRTLTFKYDVTGASVYTATLYIDDDGNSKFADNEAFATSTTGELSYSLGSFKGGPVYWKLEVVSGSGTSRQVVSTTGTAYLKPLDDEKTQVNILQLIPSGSGVEGAQGVMSLYFCPECQRTYAQVDYNPLSVGVRTSDGALYASGDGTTSYGDQYTDDYGFETVSGYRIYMGKHEHTFGVVKYDSNLANTTGAPGRDDWDWNLADELSDLYDFNLDIMTSREFDSLAQDIEDYFSNMGFDGMTAEEKAKVIEEEEAKASAALYNLNTFIDGDLAAAQDELNACIEDMIANCTSASDKEELQRLIDEECYYDYFNIEGISTYAGSTRGRLKSYNSAAYKVEMTVPNTYNNTVYAAHNSGRTYSGFEYYYQVYALAVDEKLRLEDEYKTANYRATYLDNWLLGSYDTIIIGPAENFNNDDLKNVYGLATLKEYVEEDGSVLLFHETLGRFSDAGPSNLTSALLADFGNDPYHMEIDTSLVGSSVTVASNEVVSSINPLTITYTTKSETKTADVWNFPVNAESVSISISDYQTYVTSYSGSLNKAGEISVTVTDERSDASTDPIVSATAGYKYTKYNPYTETTTSADGTVSGNTVTFKLKNYVTVNTVYEPSDVYYLPYKVQTGYDSNRYFLTNLSYRDSTDTGRYYSWVSDMKSAVTNNFTGSYYYAPNLYSSSQFIANGGGTNGPSISPYKYGNLDWNLVTKWANSAGSGASSKAGTNKASQNNSGIITTYPFTLSAQLNITGTHPSAYAVDAESDDMTVWYSLAGGTYERNNSALYAATPNDGVDNYFIYSYGNVYYCGAGHTKVTGQYKDNNDERRLYINIICNSVRNSVRQPSIDVYDYGTTNNKIIIKGTNEYVYEIDDDVEYPVFTFHPVVDDDASITNVNIYYKLDTGVSNQFVDGVDKYIVKWTGADVKSGDYVNVGSSIEALKLDDSYFEPYGGNYTYIVIEVIDSEGNVSYQRIKIVRKAHMFDLT